MHSHGIARELARQRELSIRRDLERPREPRARLFADLPPSVSIVVGARVAVTRGAPG